MFSELAQAQRWIMGWEVMRKSDPSTPGNGTPGRARQGDPRQIVSQAR
jgi:hypothetical protein